MIVMIITLFTVGTVPCFAGKVWFFGSLWEGSGRPGRGEKSRLFAGGIFISSSASN
jgi:hypothetical protein